MKDWQLIEHTDKLTDALVGLEVVPRDDLRRHISDPKCDCIPEIKPTDRNVPMLVHYSFDGREFAQPNNVKGH